MHSNLTFYPTFYQTFNDVHSTWRFTLRGSIGCVFRALGWNALTHRLWPKRSHWRGHLCIAYTGILPQTQRDVDMWFCWEHNYSSPELDLDDEQIRGMLASPLYIQEREASAEWSQVHHTCIENSVSKVHLKIRWVRKDPSPCFQAKIGWIKTPFSDGEDFSLRHQQVFGSNEPFLRFSYPANLAKSILDGKWRTLALVKRDLNSLSRNTKWDLLTLASSELQQQTHAQRSELEDAHFGSAVLKGASSTKRSIHEVK